MQSAGRGAVARIKGDAGTRIVDIIVENQYSDAPDARLRALPDLFSRPFYFSFAWLRLRFDSALFAERENVP